MPSAMTKIYGLIVLRTLGVRFNPIVATVLRDKLWLKKLFSGVEIQVRKIQTFFVYLY